jgi:hypothetical protein
MNMGRDGQALEEMRIATRLDPQKTLYHAREEELLRLMRSGSAR